MQQFNPANPLIPTGRQSCCCGLGACCSCDCLCHCQAGCICKVMLFLSFSSGLFAILTLLFRLVWLPQAVKFDATNASLTAFNLTNNYRVLNYNLAVNFTVRNPNNNIEVYYNAVEGSAFYEGQRLSTTKGPTFYQGHKSSKDYGPLFFKGQKIMVLGSEDRSNYEKQTKIGAYEIKVKLYLKTKFKLFGFIKTWTWKPNINCDLMVSLEGTSSKKFKRTKCRVNMIG